MENLIDYNPIEEGMSNEVKLKGGFGVYFKQEYTCTQINPQKIACREVSHFHPE